MGSSYLSSKVKKMLIYFWIVEHRLDKDGPKKLLGRFQSFEDVTSIE
jgi:hypothetical protein